MSELVLIVLTEVSDVQGVQLERFRWCREMGLNPARDGTDFQLFDSNGISSIRFDSRAVETSLY